LSKRRNRRRERVRHHVNPLGLPFLERQRPALALPDGTEVEVEIGCADARFLFERAPSRRDALLLGLEIREPLVRKVNRDAVELGLPNVRAHFAHANLDFDGLFPDGRLERVFINFPDPWFKRRHHKRRLLTPELAEILHRKLRPGGELFFQSDVFELALDALAVLEDVAPRLRNVDGPWSFARANPYGARSLREVRCEVRELRIWRMRYVRD
jgi:tRNA (guanine-N7-)-methyltransferase